MFSYYVFCVYSKWRSQACSANIVVITSEATTPKCLELVFCPLCFYIFFPPFSVLVFSLGIVCTFVCFGFSISTVFYVLNVVFIFNIYCMYV